MDSSNGNLFVADSANNRISVFEADGTFVRAFGWGVADGVTPALQSCIATCFKGIAGSGAGQLNNPSGIAADPVSHAVFVAEDANSRVQKFSAEGAFLLAFGSEGSLPGQFQAIRGIGVGPAGAVYVADSEGKGPCTIPGIGGNEFKRRVQVFNPTTGEFSEAFEPTDAPCGQIQGFAVHSSGEFYLANGGLTGGIRKYDPAGSPINSCIVPNVNVRALALDAAGNLFVADNSKTTSEVDELDPTCAQLRTFYGTGSLDGPPSGVAPLASDAFVSQGSGVVQVPIPNGPVVYPRSCGVSGITPSRATFKCEVNPEGKASSFHFEYVDEATYQADQPNGFENAASSTSEAVPGTDFELHDVEQRLPPETLVPETEYRFRIVVSNADGTNAEEGPPFETTGPPEVADTWATEVGSDSARAHAELNPLELVTTGRFEYVDEASFESEGGFASPNTQISAGEIDFGNGDKAVHGAVLITGLEPGTTYHYRLRGESTFGPFFGEEQILRTPTLPVAETDCANQAFRTGAGAALGDCRAYELVTPLDKDNGDIITRINNTGYPTALFQSSGDGAGFTYSSYRAFANPKSAPYTSQYLAARDPQGAWSSEAIDPPREGQFRTELENEYRAFTSDLARGWVMQEGEPTLAPCAPPGYTGLYRRESASGAYAALICPQPTIGSQLFLPELQGFAADGSAAAFRVNDELAVNGGPAPTGTGNYQVYVASGAGELRLVSVLPNGEASGEDASVGTALNTLPEVTANQNRFQIVNEAVSEDGQRIFWSNGNNGTGAVYLRQNATSEQSLSGACDEAGKACTIAVSGGEDAYYQGATPAGTKALYKVSSGPDAGSLYEFDVGSETTQLIREGVVKNILGASEDLTRIYLVSVDASAQEQSEGAEVGKPNVYLVEGGTSRFIGTLSSSGPEADASNLYGEPMGLVPIKRTARVSGDGGSVVFMSNSGELSEQAAGYDNTEVESPARCEEENEKGEEGICVAEVYLYDAEAEGGAGKLRCVSCNPSGARAIGREIAEGFFGQVGPIGAARVPRYETQLYQPRYLSEDGTRVYFNSFDPLVLRDTNGAEDVYQWEAAGSGGCKEGSAAYVPSSEGCLSLISSGQGSAAAEFLDASPSGSDVFFTTVASLLTQDYGLIDVYDARVGGGFPPPTPPPPPCEGETCQRPAPAPSDPTPASASFEGAGNVNEKATKPRCAKGKVHRNGRCVKKKQANKKQKQANKSRRAAR